MIIAPTIHFLDLCESGDPDAQTRLLWQVADRISTSLSDMVGYPMVLSAPTMETVTVYDIPTLVFSPGDEVIATYLTFHGEAHGQIVLVLEAEEALRLADLLMGQDAGTTTEIDDMARSALSEVGNITASGFLNVLAEHTHVSLFPSPPQTIHDLAGAILDTVLLPLALATDNVLLIRTAFSSQDYWVRGLLLVLPAQGE